jgi:hypothetical protein
MNTTLNTAIAASLLALLSGTALAQSSDARPGGPTAPSSQGPKRATPQDFANSGAGSTGTAATGAPVTTEGGNPALDSNVRGDRASTSDRETARTWTGVGSTGGATGTGVSSGTINDPVDSQGRSMTSGASDGSSGNAQSAPPPVRPEAK